VQEKLQEMTGNISRFSMFIIPPVALVSLFFADWSFAFNILLGGAINLVSFRAIVWAVRKFIGMQMAQAVIMGISFLKITAIFIFLIVMAYFELLLPVPLLAGFTLVLAIMIWQGIVMAGRASAK
jgi:hypothetical protein